MNQAHFHLVVNHLPIIIPFVGVLVLLGGLFLKSDLVKRVAYFIFVLGALTTIPAFASGEGAEEVVENIPGVSESFIEPHEEVAKVFALLSYALGLISALALWFNWKKKGIAPILSYVVLGMSAIVLYFGKVTGTTGGEIRHTEIRSNQSTVDQQQVDQHEEDED